MRKLVFFLSMFSHDFKSSPLRNFVNCSLFGFVSLQQIHSIIMSLNFTAIEIKTINSLDSWNGGILVMVSGSVKTKDYSARRSFVQTFLLAPQEKGYFVLNDIFQYLDEGMIYQHPAPVASDSNYDSQLNASSSPHPEPAGILI